MMSPYPTWSLLRSTPQRHWPLSSHETCRLLPVMCNSEVDTRPRLLQVVTDSSSSVCLRQTIFRGRHVDSRRGVLVLESLDSNSGRSSQLVESTWRKPKGWLWTHVSTFWAFSCFSPGQCDIISKGYKVMESRASLVFLSRFTKMQNGQRTFK